MYQLTSEARKLVCIHEAAHAVVFALGGSSIYRLVVAPVGAADWVVEGRKGGLLTDLWGACSTSDAPLCWLLHWNDQEACYEADKAGMADLVRAVPGFAQPLRRSIRAHICGVLAGPIAEAIIDGEGTDHLWESFTAGEDVAIALGYARFLPWRREYDYLMDETEKVLRRPDVWGAVIRLADVLEKQGDMEDFPGLLPTEAQCWPASPMARRRRELGPLQFIV